MTSFKEFLKAQEARVRADETIREGRKNRWATSVASLIHRMEDWLKASDPSGLLKFEARVVERIEESMGAYEVAALAIWLGSRVVVVEPIACDVMGPLTKPRDGSWSGRVDLVGPPYKFEIYRFSGSDDSDAWYIQDTRHYKLLPLDKETFESALVELFS